MNAIEVNNLSYSYDREPALNDVSFSIKEGEFVALLGSNGSGKSTLAKLLNGLLVPSEGKVSIFGMDTADENLIYDIRKNVGMVFQNPDNQMIATIIEDDIAFGPENIGLSREEIEARIDWALDAVNMKAYRKHTPFKLSGGQKQRIAIAGVLALKPRILVLDESTAMLDPRGRAEVMDAVKRLNKEEGITLIHITHYMEEAVDADRIMILDGGRLTATGTPDEIFGNRPLLTKAKLCLPPVLAVADMLRAGGMQIGSVRSEEDLVEEICRSL